MPDTSGIEHAANTVKRATEDPATWTALYAIGAFIAALGAVALKAWRTLLPLRRAIDDAAKQTEVPPAPAVPVGVTPPGGSQTYSSPQHFLETLKSLAQVAEGLTERIKHEQDELAEMRRYHDLQAGLLSEHSELLASIRDHIAGESTAAHGAFKAIGALTERHNVFSSATQRDLIEIRLGSFNQMQSLTLANEKLQRLLDGMPHKS
jgi:hypothetical protein